MSYIKFNSRRSPVYSTKGIVASSQPLASSAGIKILQRGGNSVDAAIAVSAVLCVVEPTSTGIGGDCFALFHKDQKVEGLNGCGRSASSITIQDVFDLENQGQPMKRIPNNSVMSVTIPGAIAGWVDAFDAWGSGNVTFEEILQPAIELAESGFGVHEIAAYIWQRCESKLINQNKNIDPLENPLLLNGKAPQQGDFITNKPLAKALRLIAKNGKKAFYEGPIADAIIKTTSERHHKLVKGDLASHTSTFVEPVSIDFNGYKVWEIPPNGQGLVVLLALGIIRELHEMGTIDLFKLEVNSTEYLHILIEALKLAFNDADEYVADPAFDTVPVDKLLSKEYLRSRAKLFSPDKIIDLDTIDHTVPGPKYRSDTVYLTVTDSSGNACSFINSVFYGFGSGILVPEYGFCLGNRGANFNLSPGQNNCLEGNKRPYHTIIPAMVTDLEGNFKISYGNMGGFIQPVGHVIHFLNLTLFNMNPQQSLDCPRICLLSDEDPETDKGRGGGGPVSTAVTHVQIEEGISSTVIASLADLGHSVKLVTGFSRNTFGRAQIIQNVSKGSNQLHVGGSDLRGDGAAIPFV